MRRARVVPDAAALFYSTATGKTESIAEIIKEKLGNKIEGPFEVETETDFAKYDKIICGTPTWNTGADEDRSGTEWDNLKNLGDLKKSKVACYGLGDGVGYGDYFCDALGELHDKFKGAGATMCGYVPTDGYTFDDSKSQQNGKFVGLVLDEDNENDLTDGRIDAWLKQLTKEMGL